MLNPSKKWDPEVTRVDGVDHVQANRPADYFPINTKTQQSPNNSTGYFQLPPWVLLIEKLVAEATSEFPDYRFPRRPFF